MSKFKAGQIITIITTFKDMGASQEDLVDSLLKYLSDDASIINDMNFINEAIYRWH